MVTRNALAHGLVGGVRRLAPRDQRAARAWSAHRRAMFSATAGSARPPTDGCDRACLRWQRGALIGRAPFEEVAAAHARQWRQRGSGVNIRRASDKRRRAATSANGSSMVGPRRAHEPKSERSPSGPRDRDVARLGQRPACLLLFRRARGDQTRFADEFLKILKRKKYNRCPKNIQSETPHVCNLPFPFA